MKSDIEFCAADLSPLHTMSLTAKAKAFVAVETLAELTDAISLAKAKSLDLCFLGEGSNSLFAPQVNSAVIQLKLKGIEKVTSERGEQVQLRVASGENWHDFVMYCAEQGWWGVENLALIPGTVGACPIQNIGAYGVEVASVIAGVQVLDLRDSSVHLLSPEDCLFAYRESRFKQDWRSRYVILTVDFKLSSEGSANLSYFSGVDAERVKTPLDVAELVIRTRQQKLPDPAKLPNAGSFFKNPIIDEHAAAVIIKQWNDAPHWYVDGGVKFAAGWLMDRAGLKGVPLAGGITPYDKQALVLTNPESSSLVELSTAEDTIVQRVQHEFGITLEREPNIVR